MTDLVVVEDEHVGPSGKLRRDLGQRKPVQFTAHRNLVRPVPQALVRGSAVAEHQDVASRHQPQRGGHPAEALDPPGKPKKPMVRPRRGLRGKLQVSQPSGMCMTGMPGCRARSCAVPSPVAATSACAWHSQGDDPAPTECSVTATKALAVLACSMNRPSDSSSMSENSCWMWTIPPSAPLVRWPLPVPMGGCAATGPCRRRCRRACPPT